MKTQIILASASPRRHQLFKQMGIPFRAEPADIDETVRPGLSPEQIVEELSAQKGKHISKNYQSGDALVIAADTIVTLNGDVLGKPGSSDEAQKMLARLSGNTHDVYTGVWIGQTANGTIEKECFLSERTKVTFSTLEQTEIERYVSTGSPLDKAGSYGIQDDLGALFVESIHGDYYNVVGFPMNAFYRAIKNEWPDIFNQIFSQ